jgi:flagellar hook-basal body complex protein FliE
MRPIAPPTFAVSSPFGAGGINPFSKPLAIGHITFSPNAPNTPAVGGFKNVLLDTLKQANDTVTAPNQLLQESFTNPNIDVHDVMIAGSKAELTVQLTSGIMTKVIRAYESIQQIQV